MRHACCFAGLACVDFTCNYDPDYMPYRTVVLISSHLLDQSINFVLLISGPSM